jgi:predicted dehydrogenase/threonine dehydrogenase-like Zn-dependent dehydrogenase
MKQVAQNYRSGDLTLLDVPEPRCRPGGLVVETTYSLISAGTEMMKVSEAGMSLLAKARARPDQVRKVLETASQQGPQAALTKAMNRLDSYTPLGYSLAGRVIAVGADVNGFRVGDMVACAGNQYAVHAERNWVPVNLCAKIPDGVDPRHAAFTTCGAIAMQGLRQAEVALGDVAVVIGLGLIGQLLTQLLSAAGVVVVGGDLSDERAALAIAGGARAATSTNPDRVDGLHQAVAELTDGAGADVIFLAAGGSSNQPVELAAALARDRGRVVDIGKCSLDLPWNDYYEKELDVRFSRSYGPGRYDPLYEEQGIDYPIGYVRWTEKRNMKCFLDLLSVGSIDVELLVSATEPFTEAPEVYSRIADGTLRGVGFLFDYATGDSEPTHSEPAAADTPTDAPREPTATPPAPARRVASQRVGVGFIGAGNYAKTMLLPHLKGVDDVDLRRVVTSSPLSAVTAQTKFGFTHAGVDAEAVLDDDAIDLVFIATRHSSHADLVCRALHANKAVFVEKPLALTLDELALVLDAVEASGNDRLHVGFNRRFAPMLTSLRTSVRPTGPLAMRYLVNAGRLDASSWYLESTEGSRFCGEGGHFIDTMSWWVGQDPVSVSASGSPDSDIDVRLTYPNGSTGTISYVTGGHPRFPKETFDALGGGRAARLDNFTAATAWAGKRARRRRSLTPDKGQGAQVVAVIDAIRSGAPMPIALGSIMATTAATVLVDAALADGRTHDVKVQRST